MFDGIKELLQELKNSNKYIYIATNKPEPYAKRILEHFQIIAYFESVHGVDINNPKHSKEGLIREIVDKHPQCDFSEIIMVGDTSFDIEGARNAGIETIGVGYGFMKAETLIQHNPKAIANSVEELRVLLKE